MRIEYFMLKSILLCLMEMGTLINKKNLLQSQKLESWLWLDVSRKLL